MANAKSTLRSWFPTFDCPYSIGISWWRTSKPNRWWEKINTAKSFCLKQWSITCCLNSEVLSCLSALWSESQKEWNRMCSLSAAEVSSPYITSVKFTIRKLTTGRLSHQWFHVVHVPELQAWENFYGWSGDMMERMIWHQLSAIIRWQMNGDKSLRWGRREVGELATWSFYPKGC